MRGGGRGGLEIGASGASVPKRQRIDLPNQKPVESLALPGCRGRSDTRLSPIPQTRAQTESSARATGVGRRRTPPTRMLPTSLAVGFAPALL